MLLYSIHRIKQPTGDHQMLIILFLCCLIGTLISMPLISKIRAAY